jgi:hypothetical protein
MTITIVMTFELNFYLLPTEAYSSRPSRLIHSFYTFLEVFVNFFLLSLSFRVPAALGLHNLARVT